MEERRPVGRPAKAIEGLPHWRTQERIANEGNKLHTVMNVIKAEFRTMRAFLNAWTHNEATKEFRGDFIKYGAPEVVPVWLEMMPPNTKVMKIIAQQCKREVANFVQEKGAIFRSANGGEEDTSGGGGDLLSDMDAMEDLIKLGTPWTWRMLEAVSIAVTKVKKRYPKKAQKNYKETKRSRMTFAVMMILFYARSQKLNTFQTMMGILLTACHTTKAGLEIIAGTGFCGSYNHCLSMMRKIPNDNKSAMREWIHNHGGKMNLDNVNRKIGVRDGPGTREALMDNSTGGFISPLVGLPAGMRMMSRSWVKVAQRVELDPQQLGPSPESFQMMKSWGKYWMEDIVNRLVSVRIGDGSATGDGKNIGPPVIEETYGGRCPVFPLGLMDFNQASIDGNLECIKHVLTSEMGYTNQELMDGLVLAGGDTMLVSRVRSIQMLREADVPGEDFKFVLPGLGPLHALMNYIKMLLKSHLGGVDGSEKGSLYWMNKRLRRQEVNKDATN